MEDLKKLLLISNSTNAGEAYLAYPQAQLGDFLTGIAEVAFIPYAAVTFSYDAYETKVQDRFSALGIQVRSVHRASNPAAALETASAIVVGGGNTFHLLKRMQEEGLLFSESTPTSVATFLPAGGGYASFLHGKVVDMLYFPLFSGVYPRWLPGIGGDPFLFFSPIFNLADSYISVGIIYMLLFQRKFFSK